MTRSSKVEEQEDENYQPFRRGEPRCNGCGDLFEGKTPESTQYAPGSGGDDLLEFCHMCSLKRRLCRMEMGLPV